jgi:hypothetical protein
VQIPLSVEHKKAVHDVMALEAQVTQAHARLRDETSARDQAERRAKVEQSHIQVHAYIHEMGRGKRG